MNDFTKKNNTFCYKNSFVIDITKIKTELGYQPEIGFKKGISKTLGQWNGTTFRDKNPFNPTGEYDFINYDLEDLLINVWERVMNNAKDRVRVDLLDKGMLI